MASKTSTTDEAATDQAIWPGKRITHADFAARLAARRAELGEPDLPRNSGKRRTTSKRGLLKAIEEAGGAW